MRTRPWLTCPSRSSATTLSTSPCSAATVCGESRPVGRSAAMRRDSSGGKRASSSFTCGSRSPRSLFSERGRRRRASRVIATTVSAGHAKAPGTSTTTRRTARAGRRVGLTSPRAPSATPCRRASRAGSPRPRHPSPPGCARPASRSAAGSCRTPAPAPRRHAGAPRRTGRRERGSSRCRAARRRPGTRMLPAGPGPGADRASRGGGGGGSCSARRPCMPNTLPSSRARRRFCHSSLNVAYRAVRPW